MTDHAAAAQDRRLANAGDEYEAKYLPHWVDDVNAFLSNYGLRIRQVIVNEAGCAAQVVYQNTSYAKYYTTPWKQTEEELYRLVYETIEAIVDFEGDGIVNIFSTPLFSYISGEMIGDNEVTLTIKDVKLEELTNDRGTEQKPVMSFEERDKELVINKSNAKLLAKEAGPETENWHGLRVVLHAPFINAFGKRMRSVQVKKVLPPVKNNGKSAVQQAEDAMADSLFDEEE